RRQSLVSKSSFSKLDLHKNIFNNSILTKLEEDGLTTPDDRAKELIKNLAKLKNIFALKLLFENKLNQFSQQILQDSLIALADPTPFDYYAIENAARLELHIRTLGA